MLVVEYRAGAWGPATIRPYGPLALAPTISALQYGVAVFEGLKAQRTPDGDITLFRPSANAARLNRSAERLAMAPVPEPLFLHGLRELLRVDARWVPPHGQGALYIRPSLFSIDESVRVKPAERFLFIIVTFPFAAYYAAPVDVLVTERFVRAFAGGTGDVKPAGNYAPAMRADADALQAGCQTVLWLDGQHRRYIEECGVMNVFFVIGDTAVTPSLEGTILPGITRDSVMTLLRDRGIAVEERRIALDEVFDAHAAGRLRECFGTGTAATVTQVRSIRHGDRRIEFPPPATGSLASTIRAALVGVASGAAPDRHGWLERVTPTSRAEDES
ncbi:MAG TPA: branched-chain amino acid aminotransferase [Vicinamibacterales bacterium]|nr:branched-chain amino acid aminotransferase [Vicinamibacterales bacterium]